MVVKCGDTFPPKEIWWEFVGTTSLKITHFMEIRSIYYSNEVFCGLLATGATRFYAFIHYE
jgi:hypothetical protein